MILSVRCGCSSIKHCFVMEYEIWSSENSLILSFFPEFISKMKMMKVQFNMVEFYLIVTEVELCVLNYFFERGRGQCECALLQNL